jgi:F0F1-type ATP synthase assembly protein I
MTFSRLAQLPGRIIQKMCQAGLVTFVGLSGTVVVLGGLFQGGQVLRSLVLGTVLWLLPNSYFAVKVLTHLGQVSGKSLLTTFYRAELIKLLFSGIFFIMIIRLLSVNVPVLLLAYLTSQLIFWLFLIIRRKEGLL